MVFSRSTGSPSLNLPRDTNFNSTTFLVHGDSTSGANNTMYIDNSGLEKFIPFKNTFSNYFNGGTERLNLSSSASLAIGARDYTIELWIYPTFTPTTTQNCLFSTGAGGFFLQFNDTTFSVGVSGTGVRASFTYSITPNTWTHIAVSRSGTTTYGYVNGTSISSTTDSTSYGQGGASIGNLYNGTQPFIGYISNFRLIIGTALYTSSFTPSTTALTNLPGTVLLTCQSSRIADNGLNATITTTGNTAITSGGSVILPFGNPIPGTYTPYPAIPSNGWSVSFNGSTDYLTVSPAAVSTGDFTMEFWLFNNNTWSSNFDITDGSAGALTIYFNGGNFRFAAQGSTSFSLGSVSSLSTGQWHHFVVIKSGGNIRGYADGVALAAAQADAAGYNAFTKIGGTADGYFNGFISNFRYVTNANIYDINSSTYTVPTSPLSVVANTHLLTSQSYTFVGANTTVSNVSITTAGTPSIQAFSPFTTTKAYSKDKVSGSVYYNGSTDFNTVNTNYSLPTTTTPFTLECWVYPLTQLNGTAILCGDTSAGATPFAIFGASSGSTALGSNLWGAYYDGTNWIGITSPTSSGSLTLRQWNHVALSYNGTIAILYLNGVNIGSYTGSWTTASITNGFYVGKRGDSGTAGTAVYFNGYISGVRLVEGTAIYSGNNFNPPSTPPTAISGTKLLFNATNSGIIDQTGKNNITTYGAAAVNTTQSKFGGSSLYFDGTNSVITAPYISSLHSFHLSDFTVEAWIYPLTYTGMSHGVSIIPTLIGGMAYNTTTADWTFGLNTSGILKFYYYNGAAVSINSTQTVPLNTWSHIAAVKTSSGVSLYYNGTLVVGPTAISGTPSIQAGTTLTMGAHNSTYMNAYVDDVRISKTARYSANFTPPARKFEDR